MSEPPFGLSRSQLESEVRWMLRSVPTDPAALVRLLSDLIVTLIDKNNAAIAKTLAARDDEDDRRGGDL